MIMKKKTHTVTYILLSASLSTLFCDSNLIGYINFIGTSYCNGVVGMNTSDTNLKGVCI